MREVGWMGNWVYEEEETTSLGQIGKDLVGAPHDPH